jgi:hypothetical protein
MSAPQGLHEIAADIYFPTGAIAACAKHPRVTMEQRPQDAANHAYAIATNKAMSGFKLWN